MASIASRRTGTVGLARAIPQIPHIGVSVYRSSCITCWRHALVSPPRRLSSFSARRTQLLSVSDETPNFSAIEVIVAYYVARSPMC